MSEILQIVEKASTLGITGLTVVLAFWFVLRPITAKVLEVIDGAYKEHKSFIESATETNKQNAESQSKSVMLMEMHVKSHDSVKQTLDGYADVAELATDLIPDQHRETADEIKARLRRLRSKD